MTALRHTMRSLYARLIAAKLAVVVVLALAIAHLSIVTRADTAVISVVHSWTGGWLNQVFSDVSEFAGTTALIWVTAVAVAALLGLRHFRGAVALALAVITTQAVVALAKAVMTRPRPANDISVGDPSGWSFPSAHSASAVALYVMLALIATTVWRRRQAPLFAFGAAGVVVVLVGLSRIYLGAHYPTDVLAGWLTGGILVVASWEVCSRLPSGPLARAAA
jgi:membrane-associated phospholipid phosphatase